MNDTALLIFVGGILVNGKQLNKAEKVQHVKIVENPFESGKCWKQKAIPSFYQSGLRIFVRAPEVSFCCTWKFGQKHPSLRAAAQSNIYGFITLICFGLSMWIHLSFLQTCGDKSRHFVSSHTVKHSFLYPEDDVDEKIHQNGWSDGIVNQALFWHLICWPFKAQIPLVTTRNTQDTHNFVDMVQQ